MRAISSVTDLAATSARALWLAASLTASVTAERSSMAFCLRSVASGTFKRDWRGSSDVRIVALGAAYNIVALGAATNPSMYLVELALDSTR